MTVSPAFPKPHLPPTIDSSRDSPERTKTDGSFGKVLAAALRSGAGVQPGSEGADGGFEAQHAPPIDYRPGLQDGNSVAIGDDAVRFDARPVVGRAFVPEAPVGVPSLGRAESAMPDRPDVEALPSEVELLRALALAAPKFAVAMPASGSGRSPGTAPSRQSSGPAGGGQLHSSGVNGRPAANHPNPPTARAAGASTPAARGAKSEFGAILALTSLPGEVVLSVRGLELTADEKESLMDEVRHLLAGTSFGNRTLRVVTSGRA
jgi:hypothetical protein